MRALHISPAGLFTDPNPHSEAPEGALRTADDIVLRRKGVIESRPTFGSAISGWSPPANIAERLVPVGDDTLIIDSATTGRWLSDGVAIGPIGAEAAHGHRGYARARGSTYITDETGVLKIESAGVGITVFAGLPKAMQGNTVDVDAGADGWLALSSSVAYRVCYRRTDDNDYDIRSAPSGRMVHANQLGSFNTAVVRLFLPLPDGVEVGDVVELYRSQTSPNIEPSDELFLCREHTVSVSDLAAGFVTITDRSAESGLGAKLYTNGTQNGLLASNYRPPWAGEVAEHRGSMFYANTKGAHALEIAIHDFTEESGFALVGYAAGRSATFTSGSPTFTIADTTGYEVGMLVVEILTSEPGVAGTYIPAGATILSVVANTSVTMSANALGTGSAAIWGVPWLEINGDRFYAWTASDAVPTATGYYQVNAVGAVSFGRPRALAQSIAYVANMVNEGTGLVVSSLGQSSGHCSLLIEVDHVYGTAINVRANPGAAFTPLLDETSNTSTAQDVKPHRLFWSSADLPEAVPPGNFTDIGAEEAAILRLLPVSDAMWVVKEDGVWRLSGAGADAGWRVDPVLPNVSPLGARACCVAHDRAVLWTDRGVIVLSEGGQDPVSAAIDKSLDAIQAAIEATGSGSEGAFLAANDGDDEIIVGVPASASDAYATSLYVFNLGTGAWYRWVVSAYDVIEHPHDGKLRVAVRSGTDYVVRVEGVAETFAPVIEWTARGEGDPFTMKRWGRTHLAFDSLRGVDALGLSFTSDLSTTPATATPYDPASANAVDVFSQVPAWVPRSHSMSTVLFPKATITQSTSPAWALVGLDLHFEPVGAQPRRQFA